MEIESSKLKDTSHSSKKEFENLEKSSPVWKYFKLVEESKKNTVS